MARTALHLVVVTLVAAVLAVTTADPAMAARPHFVHASFSVANPVSVSDPEQPVDAVVWVADITFRFQLAGLGRNRGVTVTADVARSSVRAVATCDDPASEVAALAIVFEGAATLTSDRNGVVKGSMTLQKAIGAAIVAPGFSDTCGGGVRVRYEGVTLTAAGAVVRLPDFDATFTNGGGDLSVLAEPF